MGATEKRKKVFLLLNDSFLHYFNYNSTSGLEKRRKGRRGGLILLVV
jgi:hypothetical protein